MIGTVFVITPTYKTPNNWLEQCVRSVSQQSIGTVQHILINDGDPDFCPPDKFDGVLITLDKHFGDYGDTPRWVGVQAATRQGAQVIAFLDADNWYNQTHLERCIHVGRTRKADVVASRRLLGSLDGDPIEECHMCGTHAFADTSSMVFFSSAFRALRAWGDMEHWQHAIDARVVWQRVKQLGYRVALTNEVTFNYRCTHRLFYESYGLPVPPGVKTALDVEAALERWECRPSS